MNEFNENIESIIKAEQFINENLTPIKDLNAKKYFGVNKDSQVTSRYWNHVPVHNKEKEETKRYEGFREKTILYNL